MKDDWPVVFAQMCVAKSLAASDHDFGDSFLTNVWRHFAGEPVLTPIRSTGSDRAPLFLIVARRARADVLVLLGIEPRNAQLDRAAVIRVRDAPNLQQRRAASTPSCALSNSLASATLTHAHRSRPR
jgi:hypothetical protein